MKEKKCNPFLIGIVILFIVTLCLNSIALSEDGKEYEEFLKRPYLYSQVINYLRQERKSEKASKLEPQDFVFLFTIDLCLALFCLWLTILLLTGTKTLSFKSYSWFLFIFNLAWFIFLLLFKGTWGVLDFLVVKLRPDLGPATIDALTLIIIVTAFFIYIWLLARTFSLNFFGACGTFFTSHLLYFLIVFFCASFVISKENRLSDLTKENLGIKLVIRSYLSDIDKITSGQNILSLVKIRPFHL